MIKRMTDLPSQPNPFSATPSSAHDISGTPGIGKEGESISFPQGEISIQDVGKEMEIPKEVEAAGVRVQPTVISIPQPMQQLGVHASGTNVTAAAIQPNTLPLTETQIAEGLHMSIVNSIRWLAEWCKRKLLQLTPAKKIR